jgi:hypothetical protein
MYVIKKCDTHGYGRNDWKVVFTSPDRESAVSYLKMEFRYILEADSDLTRDQINGKLNNYYLDNPSGYWGSRRIEMIHKDIAFSLVKSSSVEYQDVPKRPDRTELLDSILN